MSNMNKHLKTEIKISIVFYPILFVVMSLVADNGIRGGISAVCIILWLQLFIDSCYIDNYTKKD
jgi:hypothetical protein